MTQVIDEIRRLHEEILRLNRECFTLAANQCHHGYGDDYGHHRCKYQDEIERLRAALRPFALKHQIGAGYGDDDFKRASEAFGTAVLNPKE